MNARHHLEMRVHLHRRVIFNRWMGIASNATAMGVLATGLFAGVDWIIPWALALGSMTAQIHLRNEALAEELKVLTLLGLWLDVMVWCSLDGAPVADLIAVFLNMQAEHHA